MPRHTHIGEMKSKLLDHILIAMSVGAIVLGLGFMAYIIFGFPVFHWVPFFEFLTLVVLGLLGFRAWQKETNA